MKHLMNYFADKGSVVVNGVCFNNGIGDGAFSVYWAEPKEVSDIKIKTRAYVDLRDTELCIWRSDCRPDFVRIFTKSDLNNAFLINIGVDKRGNLILWDLIEEMRRK